MNKLQFVCVLISALLSWDGADPKTKCWNIPDPMAKMGKDLAEHLFKKDIGPIEPNFKDWWYLWTAVIREAPDKPSDYKEGP